MNPAFQMIVGKPAPMPRGIAARPLADAATRRSVAESHTSAQIPRTGDPSALGYSARGDQAPRGIVVLMLSSAVVLAPIPLISVVPALVIVLITPAYLEGDGPLLLIALLERPSWC